MSLSEPQKRALKAQAHHLKPVVIVGQQGLTEAVLNEIALALDHHELIKVKINAGERQERDAMIQAITKDCQAIIIHRIGHVAIFYRRNEKKPRIELP
jgi:RNA-binding protein